MRFLKLFLLSMLYGQTTAFLSEALLQKIRKLGEAAKEWDDGGFRILGSDEFEPRFCADCEAELIEPGPLMKKTRVMHS
ncbi:MAG: hypothetical protein IT573_08275 [Deltaproteobacteria bacterium]|nr:hypothetical protein [Deltaproteobacteria bacterium]